MSSNIEIQRICQYCGKEFTARTTKTQYCSHACNSKAYKAKLKASKIEKSNTETVKTINKPIEVIKAKEFLTVKEVATLLGCSLRTTYRLVDNGTIKAVNLAERLTRVQRTEINKLLEKTESKPY